VKRNQGRTGAVEGPATIRTRLGKVANHLIDKQVIDLGDAICEDGNMEACQLTYAEMVTAVIEKKTLPIGLGGGHDIAFGTFMGIWNAVKDKERNRVGIINFDAHFDLREPADYGSSGTPFKQILDEHGESVNYYAIGIQRAANTTGLFKVAEADNIYFLEIDGCNDTKVGDLLQQAVLENDHLYITIDLDGFSSAYAPGVSAPSPMGFTPAFVIKWVTTLLESKKVIACDLAELNPSLDRDNSTANLAARLIELIVRTY
jgi:formiminoglutamase